MATDISNTPSVVDLLETERARFRGFLVKRLGNEADADDLLQQNIVAILRRGVGPRKNEKAVAWFYRVLQRSLIDQARSESARRTREDLWSKDAAISDSDPELRRAVCSCLAGVIATLPEILSEILQRVDLQEEPISTVARELGIKTNAATVRLYRARHALRIELKKFCGACAAEKCHDCGCSK